MVKQVRSEKPSTKQEQWGVVRLLQETDSYSAACGENNENPTQTAS